MFIEAFREMGLKFWRSNHVEFEVALFSKFHNLKVKKNCHSKKNTENNPITNSGLEAMIKTPSRLSQATPVGTVLDQALDQIASLTTSGPSVSWWRLGQRCLGKVKDRLGTKKSKTTKRHCNGIVAEWNPVNVQIFCQKMKEVWAAQGLEQEWTSEKLRVCKPHSLSRSYHSPLEQLRHVFSPSWINSFWNTVIAASMAWKASKCFAGESLAQRQHFRWKSCNLSVTEMRVP